MNPRTRVGLVVAGAAAIAAAAVVGTTLLQTRGSGTARAGTAAVARPQKGFPPLLLDLGVRTDPTAVALRRANALYSSGRHAEARKIFVRYHDLQAEIGAAFSQWPTRTLERLKELVAAAPASAIAQLHLGLADYWAGRVGDAATAWRRAADAQPDTAAAVHAQDLLHPSLPIPGLPPFVPSFSTPTRLVALPAPQRFAALAQAARAPDVRAKLLYGVALQQLGRPVSAEREFAAAARLAPGDAEARVAAAVGLFTKAKPQLAFSRLGPLTRVFPRAPTVRFHLGLMLLWLREIPQAKVELRKAQAEAPRSALGREAARFLSRLARIGTK